MASLARLDYQRLIGPLLAAVLVACSSSPPSSSTGTAPDVTPIERPDGMLASLDFHGVLIQRTTPFTTTFSNDAIPDFEYQRYDTDGAWDPAQPDRITIPESWTGPVIFTVRAAWSGHDDVYVELKLYCGAERPIGNAQEDHLIAVVQQPPNLASPFVDLTTAPRNVEPGTECYIAFKTPEDRTLIGYGHAATLFGAYVP